MDIFGVHGRLIADYRAFTSGSVVIKDVRIRMLVERSLDSGLQWPDPWLSLNPSFAAGGHIPRLIADGVLHPECERIFRFGKPDTGPGGTPLTLHRHQRDAIEAARSGDSYVLTTGTGSGKSLAYIVPIVDRVLREREQSTSRSIKAIIVYPMNALANSQREELRKFLTDGYGEGAEPVTYARYTGQESDADRQAIMARPPDILLTNYVMLELMLTRPQERRNLIKAAKGLQFLVFDELHTYRGRQGADVAMLIRRVRDACEAPKVQCVGTSATMSSEGTSTDQRNVVAEVASRLFGTQVKPGQVIGETLVRATTTAAMPGPKALAARVVAADPPGDYAALSADPLAAWIESAFGLDTEAGTGRLVRRTPTTVQQASQDLATATGLGAEACEQAIRKTLEAGSKAKDPVTNRPLFAFRLHQFLSKGNGVYVSLEAEADRHVTRDYQLVVPDGTGRALMPVSFCRQCGQEYLQVSRRQRRGVTEYRPRNNRDEIGEDADSGYLYISTDFAWPDSTLQAIEERRLPDAFMAASSDGHDEVLPSARKYLPQTVWLSPDGTQALDGAGVQAAYVPTPFRFCLSCGVFYEQNRGRDFAKLAALEQEGRSSATSVISASVVRSLKAIPAEQLDPKAHKLLTFVDNRQDASLQAGHFNDFVQVTQLRGALHQAATTAAARTGSGLRHEDVAQRVTEALGLDFGDYARNPGELFSQKDRTNRALREVVAFRLYVDLQRGWRVTMPNLEQTGLLRVAYADLPEIAAHQDSWADAYGPLHEAEPGRRLELGMILLDELRRGLAIDVDPLTANGFDALRNLSQQHLREPWALGDKEPMPVVGTAFPRPGRAGAYRGDLAFSGRGKFGKHLRKAGQFPHWPGKIDIDDAQRIISDLMRILERLGLLTIVADQKDGGSPGYRLKSSAIIWQPGDGLTGATEPLVRTHAADATPPVNAFFRDLYRDMAATLAGLHAKEHTAQVPAALREEREQKFRTAELKLLYCSPTMELGVDISELNAVSMRNVPPTPANYAQRSGRAGRSGQPALVTTYCATGNSHDQYYFRRSQKMVAGSVAAPRLDLGNEDLVRSHVHGVWLAETGRALGRAMTEFLDIAVPPEAVGTAIPSLELIREYAEAFEDPAVLRRATDRAQAVLSGLLAAFGATSWWDEGWIERTVLAAPSVFNRACDRWRTLFRDAVADQAEQNRRVLNSSLTLQAQDTAKRRRTEAETQLRLLKNEESDSALSDFNPYRYLASEGFLPGYSFPRLPLAAFIPGAARGAGDYLQRPRFLAIREFGPRALIYHEGARYEVTRVQLPVEAAGDVVTGEARRCAQCGYHHEPRPGLDLCELCGQPLPVTTRNLLQLRTVFTRRRERISSDEEERRRAGYELHTSFRFNDHGARRGRLDGEVADDGGAIARLAYGDSATVRITNVGAKRRREDQTPGFWLNTVDGRWLSENQAADPFEGRPRGDGDDVEPAAEDVTTKLKVLPYVEDRRNILMLHLEEPVELGVAYSLMFALERGIEAVFQLEDSELVGELLPPDDQIRDRMLFAESAEGGAGVLRRLQAEPGALRLAAREALRIAHFDPDTGTDLGGPSPLAKCERGCYDCLLTYGNQLVHEHIDRRAVLPLLMRFATATVTTAGSGRTRTEHAADLINQADSVLEGAFVTWLREHGYRLPDEGQTLIQAAKSRPDYIYRSPAGDTALFVDGPVHDFDNVAIRDAEAEERLIDLGWNVIRARFDDDWSAVVTRHPSVFGTGAHR